MRTIANLFGRSPFALLQSHMDKVSECVNKIPELFDALNNGDYKGIETIAATISNLEHNADLIKNDIRNNLPKGLFLQIDRGNILEILGLQDDIADAAEDIGVLLTLCQLKTLDILEKDVEQFLSKNIETYESAKNIIQNLDELVHYSFGGIEAQKVLELVDIVAYREHEADVIQRAMLKKIFTNESLFTMSSFHLWLRIVDNVGSISDLSEKLANRIRMTLELN